MSKLTTEVIAETGVALGSAAVAAAGMVAAEPLVLVGAAAVAVGVTVALTRTLRSATEEPASSGKNGPSKPVKPVSSGSKPPRQVLAGGQR